MIGTLLQNRYRIDARLGEGGMGVIYRAHDTRLERDVAVKVVSGSGLGSEGRARLLREAQAAARLNHPNIVSIYDAGEADGTPFIVMELVEGEPLHQRAPRAVDDLIDVTRQICAALDHAHANGIVHRDLKPENILMTLTPGSSPQPGEGSGVRVKLTDFGLARSLTSRVTTDGTIVGTVFYMAPELAMGKPFDGRADLYALGVMLYEFTTGRLPFDADDPLAVISQHLYSPVVPPSTYASNILPALDALIVRLMSKSPDDRPASAVEVLRALDHLHEPPPAAPEAELSLLDRIARGKVVGRDKELAEAHAHWQRAVSGDGHVLLISGEPGIGKTRLARDVVAQALASGAIVLSGECYSEGGAPYAPIAQAFRETVSDPRHPIEHLNLPETVVVDLLKLALDPRAREAIAALDPQAEQQRLFESVVAWIGALAARAPLLLFVDDVHWADGGTLALLRHVARRARKLRLLIMLTYREIELDEARPLNDMLGDLSRERLAARIKLARLSEAQTRDLLHSMLAEDVTPFLVESIYHETEGNPFFVEEVVKVLVEEEKIYRDDGRWCCSALDAIAIPQSIRLTIQSRVGKLPEPVQEALRMAAVLGREFDFDTLKQASGEEDDALIGALEIAEQAQLIGEANRPARGRASPVFSFAHALIPSTLREGVSGLRRQRLHRRAAAAIEALRPDDFEALAYQYDEAGDEERARTYLVRAGDRARSLYANQDAIKFYTSALALLPDDAPARFDALASRAAVFDLIAQRDKQKADIEAMLALADRLNDDTRRCDALIALADYYDSTDIARAREPAEQAIALARALNDPLREGHALRRLGWSYYFRSEGLPAREVIEAASARFRDAGLIAEAAACLNMLALVHLFNLGDRASAQRVAEEAVALSRQARDRRQETISLRRLAMVYGAQKRRAEELALTEQVLTINRALGDRFEERNTLYNLGVVYAHLGRMDESERTLQQSLELAQAIGSSNGVNASLTAITRYHLFRRGEYEAALALYESHLAQARSARDDTLEAMLSGNSVLVLAKLGLYARALQRALDLAATAEQHFGPTVFAGLLSIVGQLLGLLGRFEEAEQNLTRAIELVEETGTSADIAYKWAAQANVDLLHGERSGDAGLLRRGIEQSRLALATLRKTESEEDYADEIHTAARLHLLLGELDAALARSNEMLHLMETLPVVINPEWYLFTHSQILRGLGRAAEADDTLRRAHERVTLVADRLQDESLRRAWLDEARLHPEIAAEWQKHRPSPW